MSAKTIDQLSPAASLTGNEILPMVQDGATVRATAQQIADLTGKFSITTENIVRVRKNPKAGEYSDINIALAAITTNTFLNQFLIDVGVGIFTQDTINLKPYVHINGAGRLLTVIQSDGVNKNVINAARCSSITDCKIQGATGSGFAGIYFKNDTSVSGETISFFLENCQFGNNNILINSVQGLRSTIIIANNILVGLESSYVQGIQAFSTVSTAIRQVVTSLSNSIISTSTITTDFIFADGIGTSVSISSVFCTTAIKVSQIGVRMRNGSFVRLFSCAFRNFSTGIFIEDVGTETMLNASGLNLALGTFDIVVESASAAGTIDGIFSRILSSIDSGANIVLNRLDSNVINVSKVGGDYDNVYDALNSITDNSDTNRYVIKLGVGIFSERFLDFSEKPYVSLVGTSIQDTIIKPDSDDHDCINIGVYNELSFLGIYDVGTLGSGHAAVTMNDSGDFGQLHKVTFLDCDVNIYIKSTTQDTFFYGEYIDFNGAYSIGIKVEATNGFVAFANVENYYNLPSDGNPVIGNYITGPGSEIHVLACGNSNDGLGTAFYLQDGAFAELVSTNIDLFDKGIVLANVGAASSIAASGITCKDITTYDIEIAHPSSTGTIGGVINSTKIVVNQLVSILGQDTSNGRLLLSGGIDSLYADGEITDVSTIITETSTMGLISGGIMSDGGGLNLDIAAGFGYHMAFPYTGQLKRLNWGDSSIAIPANSHLFVYINYNGILSYNGARPDPVYNIIFGRVVTDASNMYLIIQAPTFAQHTPNLLSTSLKIGLGSLFGSGCIVTENATPLKLDVTAGSYALAEDFYSPSAGTAIEFDYIYNSGNTIVLAQDTISNTQYDDAGTLTSLTAGYYAKGTLYNSTDGANQKWFAVYPQAEYSSLLDTQLADNPTPAAFMQGAVVIIASIIVQEGNSSIVQIIDERPRSGTQASGVNASADHLSLLNLNGGDEGDGGHTNMFTVSGSKAMTGNLDAGGNDIINVNLVDGVDISEHASRHLPNGSDPITSAAPTTNLSGTTTNTVGIQNSFARSDHSHAITTAALTKTDDTNVTLTLGGTPASSLLKAVSLTLGWTGTLADSRITSAATWNAKQDELTIGNLTEATSSVLTITGGTGSIIGSGLSIQVKLATTAQAGYLSSTDWNTFNNKQSILVSGTNIKTVNGSSLLDSGNLVVGDALVANTLSQFASTSSLQLKGVINDETGSGSLVFADTPTLITPILGTPTSGNLENCTFPTFNQNTSGSASSLSISGQTGLISFSGLTSTNRIKTARDADDTILELGGSYTPAGTWTSMTLVAPILGTPASGNLANCTFPTLNQNTSGSAATLTTPRNINGVSFNGSANITITANTTNALTIGTGLSLSSGTTFDGSSARTVTIDSTVTTLTGSQTLVNKRVTRRVITTTQSATPTINTDNGDIFEIVGLAQAITSMTTNLSGSPVEGDMIQIIIKDNGTARNIAWGASFVSSTVFLPTTTVISTPIAILLQYRTAAVWTASSAWYCISVA